MYLQSVIKRLELVCKLQQSEFVNSRLPSWIASIVPNIFYITEKAWNYYPYTITGKFKFKFLLPLWNSPSKVQVVSRLSKSFGMTRTGWMEWKYLGRLQCGMLGYIIFKFTKNCNDCFLFCYLDCVLPSVCELWLNATTVFVSWLLFLCRPVNMVWLLLSLSDV